MRAKFLFGALLALSLLLISGVAVAKYPEKPITLIIPFNPGGQSDVAAQVMIPALEEELGVDIIPQYRVGAGGAVGWAILANKPADGYTMAVTNLPHIILQPLMIEGTPYKTGELQPVYVYATTPGVSRSQ